MAQRVKEKRTLIKFGVQSTTYVSGVGSSTVWETVTVPIGTDAAGNEVTTDCFYCEWLNSYGQVAIQQQADGVNRPARVRMPYVATVYDALTNKAIRIYKNGIVDDAHTFQLASAADNYIESNKMLEFNVKKYEGK